LSSAKEKWNWWWPLTSRFELKSAPGFFDADGVDLFQHAQPLEDRQVVRQQRFADVKARVVLFLEQGDAPALLREQGRDGRAGRSAAHDKDVALVHGRPSLRWNLGFDEFRKERERFLPPEIASLGRNRVRYPFLHDVQLGTTEHLL